MRYWLLIVAVQVVIVGPVDAHKKKPAVSAVRCPDGMVPSSKWEKSDLIGHTLKQVHTTILNVFSFTKDGLVPAHVGRVGGPQTAPLWEWRLDRQGVLSIVEERKVMLMFRKICAGPDRVLVTMGRTTATMGRTPVLFMVEDYGTPASSAKDAPSNSRPEVDSK